MKKDFFKEQLGRIIFCLLFVFSSLFVQAKSLFPFKDTINGKLELIDKKEKRNILKLTPLRSINLVNPSVELSYERNTSESLSTQVSISYLLSYYERNLKGFKVGLEEKYYFKKTAPMDSYFSFEVNYLNNSQHRILGFYSGEDYYDESKYYADSCVIRKQIFNFNLKYGNQIIYKHFVFDVCFGIGLRYRNVRHFDRLNPNDKMQPPEYMDFTNVLYNQRKNFRINLPLNLRIGYSF